MENLFGQEYKNGFVVNTQKPQFISLSTNMKLGTNIDKAQYDYENQVNKLFNINGDYGNVAYLPKGEYIKVKEANTLLERQEPKIIHREHEEYDNLRRLNLQIQNRLNEREQNQIDTAFAPQGLTNNQVLALSSTKPKLQKEIEAIDEYARTHFLTPDQTKKLKDDLVKKNYDEWVRTVEGVKIEQEGGPEFNPINNTRDTTPNNTTPNNTTPNGTTQDNTQTVNEEDAKGFLSWLETLVPNLMTGGQPKETMDEEQGINAETKEGDDIPRRRQPLPKDKNPLLAQARKPKTIVAEGDRPIQAPERPQRLDAQQVIDDFNLYPDDYINGRPIVSLTSIPTEKNINDMVKIYFEKYFLKEFRGTTMINTGTANKFLSFFQPLTPKGRSNIENLFFRQRLEKKDYIERLFTALNDVYQDTNPAKRKFIELVTETINTKDYIVMPISPLQREQFMNVFTKFVHKCRSLLISNAPELYMQENQDGLLEFKNIENLNLFRQSVQNGIITGKNIFDFSRVGTPQNEMKDTLEYEKILKEIREKKKLEKSYADSKMKKEEEKAMGKNTRARYPAAAQENHEKIIEELKELERRRKELGKRLGRDDVGDNNGGAAAAGGGNVRIGEDGKEIVNIYDMDR